MGPVPGTAAMHACHTQGFHRRLPADAHSVVSRVDVKLYRRVEEAAARMEDRAETLLNRMNAAVREGMRSK